MMHSDLLVAPMREDLTRIGFTELRTAEDVDDTLPKDSGTTMVVVNSICGCAARIAWKVAAISRG